ncbi:FAD-dependent oxidoreductase [Nocardia sp. 2YAB30]|uniref:FAD-dependent oxidoreductase n=1 Tax=unclassified Nocardia TaxID=2637762 RepID=UPI003F950330
MNGNTVSTDVLIAGGGSVGLMLAVLLRHHGVKPFVVEEKPELSPHPRATGIGSRSVEILREVGLDHAVNEAAVDLRAGKIRGRTLQRPTSPKARSGRQKPRPSSPTHRPGSAAPAHRTGSTAC